MVYLAYFFMVYLAYISPIFNYIWLIFYGKLVVKYTSHMDPIGVGCFVLNEYYFLYEFSLT